MSEGGTLFNQGFLGAGSFHWWVGQVADDSTWRDNIIPGKIPSEKQIKGWGYRYKVRIIGYHDQDPNKSIPDDQLPWAQVMYPITAGGGQGQSLQTPNIRQGNFVFGFFLDGSEGQNPVIMGVLGNNAQTQLGNTINKGFVPISGYAKGKSPDPNIKAPDHGLKIEKPSTSPAASKPGVKLDKYGRDPSRPPTAGERVAAAEARAEADRLGLTGESKERLVAEATVAQTKKESAAAASPSTPPQPGATLENSTAVHQTTNADVIRNDMYLRKTALSSPCKRQNTDLKNIKVVIENLTNDINKIQQAANSYIDAVSSKLSSASIQSLIDSAAVQISKFMKNIFDKVRGYVLKVYNKTISPTIDKVLPNARFKIMELKEKGTQQLVCLFNNIIGKLFPMISNMLKNILSSNGNSSNIKEIAPEGTAPKTPICKVETIVGNVLGQTINDITTTIDKCISPLDVEMTSYINDFNTLGSGIGQGTNLVGAYSGIAGQVSSTIGAPGSILNNATSGILDASSGAAGSIASSITSSLDQISSVVGGFSGNIESALSFVNGVLQFFSCDDGEKCPANDIHTLQNGGGSTEPPQEPNTNSVAKAAENAPKQELPKSIPFASPSRQTPDVNYGE